MLGLMVQNKDSIPRWTFDALPPRVLTSKGVEWDWTRECDGAFKRVRHACLDNDILATPDCTKQFFVAGNASNDSKGVQLYQLRDPTAPDTLAKQ